MSKSRRDFLAVVHSRARLAYRLGFTNEAVYLLGMLISNYAILMGYVAVVQAIASIQSVYMIEIGALLTEFTPHIIKEDISRGRIIGKL